MYILLNLLLIYFTYHRSIFTGPASSVSLFAFAFSFNLVGSIDCFLFLHIRGFKIQSDDPHCCSSCLFKRSCKFYYSFYWIFCFVNYKSLDLFFISGYKLIPSLVTSGVLYFVYLKFLSYFSLFFFKTYSS